MKAQKEGSTMKQQRPITTPNKSAGYLRSRRESLGLSLNEAAENIGVSARTLRRYERQGLTGSVRCNRIRGLCLTYGISVDDLWQFVMQPV